MKILKLKLNVYELKFKWQKKTINNETLLHLSCIRNIKRLKLHALHEIYAYNNQFEISPWINVSVFGVALKYLSSS